MALARLVVLMYVFVAASSGVDAQPIVQTAEARLAAAAQPAHEQLQSADDDADDDDDDLVDADFDDDVLPSATPALAAAPGAGDRLILESQHDPESAARDPLFRPPRHTSA